MNSYLTISEIKESTPCIFTNSVSPEVSKHYTHVPSFQVIDDMDKLGWKVKKTFEVKARKGHTMGFQKHLIVFENPNLNGYKRENESIIPQIYMTNSRNGKNSFHFMAGLFRPISDLWYALPDEYFSSVRIRHIGYSFEELEKQVFTLVESLPNVVNALNKLVSTNLTENEMIMFAKEALSIRLSDEQIEEMDIESFVFPQRVIDKGNSLWKVMNVVQEKILMGTYTTGLTKTGKLRKARQIKNFEQYLKVNKFIFIVALNYIK